MSARGSLGEEGQVLERSALIRRAAVTAEQRRRREVVSRRTLAISRGVKPPASGVYGRPKGAK